MTLYQLTDEYKTLYEMLTDPAVDPEVVECTLEAVDGEIEAKAEGYAMVRAQLKADVEALKTEEERLSNRRKSVENNIKRLEKSLQETMEITGKTKFKTALFSFGIQNNPASVVIDDASKVPANFLIPQEPKIDKAAIKELLKEVGTVSWAHTEQTRGLRIR